MKPSIVDVLTRFIVKVARRVTGMNAFCRNGEWFWPSKTEAMKLAGFHSVLHYIQRRRATIFPWVEQRPLYLACKQASMAQARAGSRGLRWWFQAMERPPTEVTDETSQSSATSVRPARRVPRRQRLSGGARFTMDDAEDTPPPSPMHSPPSSPVLSPRSTPTRYALEDSFHTAVGEPLELQSDSGDDASRSAGEQPPVAAGQATRRTGPRAVIDLLNEPDEEVVRGPRSHSTPVPTHDSRRAGTVCCQQWPQRGPPPPRPVH